MRKRGFIIKRMGEDGACLFRAVSDQVYGDQEMHSTVRKHCMDYIVSKNASKSFSPIRFSSFNDSFRSTDGIANRASTNRFLCFSLPS